MNTVPDEFKKLLARPDIKASILAEYEPGGTCRNCGGRGTVGLTVGFHGPFRTPPNTKSPTCAVFISDRWWVGEHFMAACPVCKGEQIAKGKDVYTPMKYIQELAKQLGAPGAHRRTADEDTQAHARAEQIKAAEPITDEGPDNWNHADEHNDVWYRGESEEV